MAMATERAWAEQQWGGIDLGDPRRTRRAVAMGAALAGKPQAGLPVQMGDWAGLKGAYRLLDRPEATLAAITAPHRRAVLSQAQQAPGAVLFIQDDTTLDLTTHHAMHGRGRIGNDHGLGFLVHNCLALAPTPAGPRLLGLASQTLWARTTPPVTAHETRAQRRTRPTEAEVWAQSVSDLGACPPGQLWISRGDRGADVFSHFVRAQALGWQVLVRVYHDRCLADGHLTQTLRALPAMTARTITMREGGKRRSATVSVAWTPLLIQPPQSCQEMLTPLAAVGLRVWNATVEWRLLTTLAVEDAASAQQVIEWCASRWMVEEFHKALKTGCRIEQRQVRTAARFQPLLGFLSLVAVRLLQIRQAAREEPQTSTHEPEPVVALLAAALKTTPAAVASHRDFYRGVARLGGFLARKGDGEPGWLTLWGGFERLFLIMLGAQIANHIDWRGCG